MCPCIFGYECPQIASGWGGAGEGEGWRESNKGALLSAHFLMFSSLWRNKSRGVKHSPLAQLGHSCTLCATRKTKTYWTVNITWLTTVFPPLVNISSLFSCLACWNTKGNVSPDKLGIMTFLAGQLLVSGHVSPRCLKPQIFSFSLCLIFLCPLISSLCYNPWAAHFMFCFHSTYCHFSQLRNLRFGESNNGIHISKDSSYKCQDAPSKGNRENKWK